MFMFIIHLIAMYDLVGIGGHIEQEKDRLLELVLHFLLSY